MIKLNAIKVYEDAPDRYYTDGVDVFYFENGYRGRMKWQTDKDGYYFVMLFNRNRSMSVKQHRLVYFYYHNELPPNGWVIDHVDLDKTNNRLDNLRLVPPKINSNNVDWQLISESHSKYHYDVVDGTGQEILTNVTAGTIQSLLGLPSGLVNRYMKRGFVYKGEYLILKHERVNYDR